MDVIIFKILGHAPGLACGLLLRASVHWALGRVVTKLLWGLIRLLLRLRDHLVYDFLGRGFYMYAHKTMYKCHAYETMSIRQNDFATRR